jgi:membrane protein
MSSTFEEHGIARVRALAAGLAGRLGGLPAVQAVAGILGAYDRAGGGLVAGGLAYAALIALLPGLLLVLSVFGLVVNDPAVQDHLVDAIATAFPPLEPFARTALQQVSAGAIAGSVLAFVGLLWASSRFYSALDFAMARIFVVERARNEVVRTLRGLLLATMLVALPIAMVFAGAATQWLLDRIPDAGLAQAIASLLVQLATPIGSIVLFVLAAALVYRYVPAEPVPAQAWRLPAIVVGLLLAAFTQLFAFLAPLMLRTAALYGAIVAVFALLAWLSIGFNMLLIGAGWTRVRAVGLSRAALLADAEPPATDGDGPAEA